MEKSVAKAHKQLNQILERQEVDPLVQTPRRTDEAAGNRLRICLQRFEEMAKEVRLTKACESAGFMRRVTVGMYYKSVRDVNDGFDGQTAACREKTKPREDPGSDIKAWIECHTKMGPVLQVKTTCCIDIYGIGIQIPSTSGDGSKSLVIISKGSNRYVEESHYNDPDYSPGSH